MNLDREKKKNIGDGKKAFFMVGPMTVWFAVFLLVPLFLVVIISFMTKGTYGGVQMPFTLDGYKGIINGSFLKILWKSIVLAFNTSWIALLIGYPFAYVISKICKKSKGLLMLLIILPFWVTGLIRLNAWTIVLRDSGIVNSLLLKLGIIKEPIVMMFTEGAALFGMVYVMFPFMVLPLITSISKIDDGLIEAAHDLGAKKVHTFFRVILPMTTPGIFAGVIQVFIPALGAYYVTDAVAGGSTVYLGNLIKNEFMTSRNWPTGAALAILMILFTLLLLKIYSRFGKLSDLA